MQNTEQQTRDYRYLARATPGVPTFRLIKEFSGIKTIPLKGGCRRYHYPVFLIHDRNSDNNQRKSFWGEAAYKPLPDAEHVNEIGASRLLAAIYEKARIDLRGYYAKALKTTVSVTYLSAEVERLEQENKEYRSRHCTLSACQNCGKKTTCEPYKNLQQAKKKLAAASELYYHIHEIANLFGDVNIWKVFQNWCDAKYGYEYDEDGNELAGYIKCHYCTVPTDLCGAYRELRLTGKRKKQ